MKRSFRGYDMGINFCLLFNPGPQRGGPGPLFQNEENSIYYLQFYLIPPNKSL